jgi:hypothetical protein
MGYFLFDFDEGAGTIRVDHCTNKGMLLLALNDSNGPDRFIKDLTEMLSDSDRIIGTAGC